jgi:hypothetical protein
MKKLLDCKFVWSPMFACKVVMMTALTKVKCILWDRLEFLCTHESGLRSEGGTEGSPEDGAGVRNNFL